MTTTHSATFIRMYSAPPERVWAAWTDVAVLARWYGCAVDQLWTIHAWDVRLGGKLHVSMDFDGTPFVVEGTFLDVVEPTLLRYTFGGEQVITVAIAAHPQGSEVTITHDGLPSEAMIEIVTGGWSNSIEQLADAVAATLPAGAVTAPSSDGVTTEGDG